MITLQLVLHANSHDDCLANAATTSSACPHDPDTGSRVIPESPKEPKETVAAACADRLKASQFSDKAEAAITEGTIRSQNCAAGPYHPTQLVANEVYQGGSITAASKLDLHVDRHEHSSMQHIHQHEHVQLEEVIPRTEASRKAKQTVIDRAAVVNHAAEFDIDVDAVPSGKWRIKCC